MSTEMFFANLLTWSVIAANVGLVSLAGMWVRRMRRRAVPVGK